MDKKSKTVNKTKSRRTKERVYQMPSLPSVGQCITPTYAATYAPFPTESICNKARRLANEAEEAKKRGRAKRELAFTCEMFETDDLVSKGIQMTLKTEYPYKDCIVYTICGRQWVYSSSNGGCLLNIDEYMNMPLSEYPWAFNLKQFGEILQEIDARERDLHTRYPNTWWGRFTAWLNNLI